MDDKLTRSIDSATQALLARQRPDGHWVFELEADATIPAEYVLLRHYLGEPVDAALRSQDRRLSAPHPGRPRRLAAARRRRSRCQRDGEGLFRAEDDRRTHRRRSHAPGPRGGAGPRRRRARQCLYADHAGFVRLHSLARGAGDADRDHAVAEMVSVPSRQDLVLEPHRHRAAVGADGEEAAGAQRQGRAHRRAVSRAAAEHRPDAEGAAAESVVVLVLPRRRQCFARHRTLLS